MSATLQFFGFANVPTHRYFMWLTTNNPGVNLEKIVAATLEEVEDHPDFVSVLGGDVSRTARTILAEKLDDMLRESLEDFAYELCDFDTPLDGSAASLRNALLGDCYTKVDTPLIAEAILRMQMKWSPDLSIPEAI